MQPRIERTAFGSINLGGEVYRHDIVIALDGTVRQRSKQLSKRVYGTSHRISLVEARDVDEAGCELLLIGSGQFGRVGLSSEAQDYFDSRGVAVEILPTPAAAQRWNDLTAKAVALFHVTC